MAGNINVRTLSETLASASRWTKKCEGGDGISASQALEIDDDDDLSICMMGDLPTYFPHIFIDDLSVLRGGAE